MSLFKQIALIVVFFQIITLGGVVYKNFHSVNEQIQNRLFSDAQDTATSLGLSISMVAEAPESDSRIKTMINAIFDSGYYRSIVLKDVDDKVIYEKQNPEVVYSVPQWFVDYVRFDTPVAKSEIMSGWSRFGTIYIYNHNGHAYAQMWDVLNSLLKWFGIIFISAVTVLYFLLRAVFRPLKKVQYQAEAILQNDFILNSDKPFTTELQDVTSAMNSMVLKVKDIFTREVEAVKKYRDVLCRDQEFDVANRHYFISTFASYLDEKDSNAFGVLGMIRFVHVDQMKNRSGYDDYYRYFKALLKVLEATGNAYSNDAIIARFSSITYAILLPGRDVYKAMEAIGNRLLEDINAIDVVDSTVSAPMFSIGMTRYNANTSIKTIMSYTDYALLQAELKKENNYHLYQKKNDLEDLMLLGREVWVKAISEAIAHHRLEWVSQACLNVNSSEVYHHEIYTKMRTEDGDILSAEFFLPIAKYAELLVDIDSYLFKTMMQRDEIPVALNISIDSIKNSMFTTLVQEFANRAALKRKKPHIHFELNFNSIGGDVERVADFSKMLRRLGYSFGIDHFMFWPNSIDLIGTIAPTYLKVSVEHLANYAEEDSLHMMQSIHNITATYGVAIIAVNVENEEHKNILNKIDISLIQGRYIEDIKTL